MKRCAKCGTEKPLDEFHRQPKGPMGRHSYCKPCANDYMRANRVRNYSPEQKRRWQLKTRYGVTPAEVTALIHKQGGVCAVCMKPLAARRVVDHDHATGKVRGIVCPRCNVWLAPFDAPGFPALAAAYLGRAR